MKVFVWANSDMDGAASVILMKQIFKSLDYSGVFFGELEEKMIPWYDEHEDEYDKIFIIGCSLNQSLLNKIDSEKVVIINDRDDGLTSKYAKIKTEEFPSCTLYIYKLFSEALKLSKEMKRLVKYVNDYNSYALETEEAQYLNGLFRKSGSNRFDFFINRFENGYDGFTFSEKRIAQVFFKELEDEFDSLDLFHTIYDEKYKILGTFSDKSVNEIAGPILNQHKDVDAVIVISLRNKYVSFRKREGSDIDIVFLAENLCSGGGGQYASAGRLTSRFMKFTKNFEPYERSIETID